MKESYDLIVLGSGPGGYVAAIRGSQLGLKTAIIEKESLGGVCLNWGCIPTKALLKSAQVFEYLKKADQYGLSANKIDKDFSSIVKRSRSVADGMSKGVAFLMKKNKIDVLHGMGSFIDKNNIKITDSEGKETQVETDKVIIATGSKPSSLPFISSKITPIELPSSSHSTVISSGIIVILHLSAVTVMLSKTNCIDDLFSSMPIKALPCVLS